MWIIQRKLFKGDWETIASSILKTKKAALADYEHMNGKLRAVSESRAWTDYEAGRADNYRRVLGLNRRGEGDRK